MSKKVPEGMTRKVHRKTPKHIRTIPKESSSSFSETNRSDGRWLNVVEKQNKHGTCNGCTWRMIAEKREDIYPLIGGKHKKWFLFVTCNVDGKNHERKFESCEGYNG